MARLTVCIVPLKPKRTHSESAMRSVVVKVEKAPVPLSMIPHAVDKRVAVVPFVADVVLVNKTNKVFDNLQGPAKRFAWIALSCFGSFFKRNQHDDPSLLSVILVSIERFRC